MHLWLAPIITSSNLQIVCTYVLIEEERYVIITPLAFFSVSWLPSIVVWFKKHTIYVSGFYLKGPICFSASSRKNNLNILCLPVYHNLFIYIQFFYTENKVFFTQIGAVIKSVNTESFTHWYCGFKFCSYSCKGRIGFVTWTIKVLLFIKDTTIITWLICY